MNELKLFTLSQSSINKTDKALIRQRMPPFPILQQNNYLQLSDVDIWHFLNLHKAYRTKFTENTVCSWADRHHELQMVFMSRLPQWASDLADKIAATVDERQDITIVKPATGFIEPLAILLARLKDRINFNVITLEKSNPAIMASGMKTVDPDGFFKPLEGDSLHSQIVLIDDCKGRGNTLSAAAKTLGKQPDIFAYYVLDS